MEKVNLLQDDFLAVVSYPSLDKRDKQWIQAYRSENDFFYELIDAHFTFVFPSFGFDEDLFIEEVKKQAMGFKPFDFQIRCALLNNDRTNECWHVLLVPDQGFSQVVHLHDKLHSELLSSSQRLDFDFLPHIAIGNSKDAHEAKKMVDQINSKRPEVSGRVDRLDIIEFHQGAISTIDYVLLGEGVV